jgi:hypothetical protein
MHLANGELLGFVHYLKRSRINRRYYLQLTLEIFGYSP